MRRLFFVIAILFLAFILRFYKLGQVPISLEWDEVALGYDAYSILNTGKDQFGKFFPSTFRSLDDYKPPIYEYATVPPVAIFGLNEFAVRFPSALFGTLTVLLTYLLVKVIFDQIPQFKKSSLNIALIASFLLAISPWHLQFSRAAFEVNLSVFITVAALLSFFIGLKKPKYFLLSSFLFGFDLFSYHSTRVITPLLLIFLFFIFNKNLPSRKTVLGFLAIYGLFFLGFIPILLSPDAQIRFRATNIFNPGARYTDEKDLPKIFLDKRLEDKNAGFELAGKIFHNQRLIYTDYDTLKKAFFKYLSHFDFEFLFVKGDAPLHHAPDFGLLYLWEFPFLITGLFFMFKNGLNRYSVFLPIWMLLAPLPVAVTREAPHAVRSELILPTFQIFTAVGLIVFLNKIKNESHWVKFSLVSLAVSLLMINNSNYLHQYFVHTNYDLSKYWLYGRKEAVEFTEQNKVNFDKVLVSMKVDMPFIFWLFYSKYPPETYLHEGGTVSGGFANERNHFDKYEFRNFDYNSLPSNENLLLVGTPDSFPDDAKILKTIYYLDGTQALKIAANK
ncbi:glycosyltransferase family 39 protein [Candidatus Gottesmanbacteria bacterium]|nr:glycosyltransferase family 39 protein [Candidatus Gottesmanbacteria bacterium]